MRMGQGWGGWRPARWVVPLAFLLVSSAGAILIYHVGARAYLFLELLQAVDITHPSLPTEIKSAAQDRPSPDFPLTARIERILPASSSVRVAWNQNGTLVAVARIFDGRVTVWDRRSGEVVREFRRSFADGVGEPLAFTSDGQYLITGASDGGVTGDIAFTIWSMASGTVAKQVKGSCPDIPGLDLHQLEGRNHVSYFTISPDGALVATIDGCRPPVIRIYEAKTWLVVTKLKIDEKNLIIKDASGLQDFFLNGQMTFSPDGKILAVAGLFAHHGLSQRTSSGAVVMFDVAAHSITRMIEANKGFSRGVQGMSFSPDGRFIATGAEAGLLDLGSDGNPLQMPDPIRVWHVADGTLAWPYRQPFEHVWALVWDPRGRYLASATGGTSEVVLWPITAPQAEPIPAVKYFPPPLDLAVTKDGRYLAAVNGDKLAIIHVSK